MGKHLPTLTGNLSDDFCWLQTLELAIQESQLKYEVMDDDIIKGYTVMEVIRRTLWRLVWNVCFLCPKIMPIFLVRDISV